MVVLVAFLYLSSWLLGFLPTPTLFYTLFVLSAFFRNFFLCVAAYLYVLVLKNIKENPELALHLAGRIFGKIPFAAGARNRNQQCRNVKYQIPDLT